MVRRTVWLVVAGMMAGVVAGIGTAQAQPGSQDTGLYSLRLPAPSGPHRVGVTSLHLVDRSRPDPWGGGTDRELMTTVFYPARTTAGYHRATQMGAGAAAAFEHIDTGMHDELPQGKVDWAATRTDAYVDAPASTGRHPVLLYSPGLGDPRTIGTGVAEDLASRGYVVVTVDHPGEASEVEFPDGRVRTIAMPTDPGQAAQTIRTASAARTADTKFVLDKLETLVAGHNPDADQRRPPKDLARALDISRVGTYGHSAGGSMAVQTMYEDNRIDAAINMDGNLSYYPEQPGRPGELFPVAKHGVNRPVLLLGSQDGHDADLEYSWSALLDHQQSWIRRLQLNKAAHHVFTDYAGEAAQLQAAKLMSEQDRTKLVGEIDPREAIPAVRDYIASFFDKQLRRHDDHLLDGPCPGYPDMAFLR